MAVINYTLHHFGGSLGTARTIVKWSSLAAGDTGQPFDIGDYYALSISKELSGEDIDPAVYCANSDTAPAPGSSTIICPVLGALSGGLVNFRARWYWPETTVGADTATIYLLIGSGLAVQA